MPYLVAAVVLASALGTLNLLLTLAVIRRLREHTELLAGLATGAGSGIIEAGQTPGDFAVTDTDGSVVRRENLGGDVLVAFFSPDCPACTDALPRFVTQAAGFPGGRVQVLGVVTGDGPGVTGLADRLNGVARVVVDGIDGKLATAFQARAFPSWCLLDATGTVARSGSGWTELPVPVPA
ncbi:TlpA family protein disulfide reductase [Plantactinospora sp. S1510]|uniref:TlpA family protein disulfide reductase n=1 Tax=Plantactinospora alkalitolerans TaxID=2789879 RepID=A0ABS0GWC7_9ACTN|nr:TlpA disulfide reductase family protein [Plantactinospora alkalitolerans]MBF9130239.1 TlpA family protein disulfide reductase [Plantactinospora alkalitolerans]